MSSYSNNLLNQKLGLGYLSSAFETAGVDNIPHPNSRIREYKFDVINLGTLRNVIPTAVLRKNLYADNIISRRKQWAFENIVIKNDQKIYEAISQLAFNFYGDYSYFAPYKIRFEILNSNFFKQRLESRPTILKNIDRNLPYTRLQFPSNISNTNILTGSRVVYTPINIQNNVITANYYISGYNSGINYANRNTFVYRKFNNASGYIPYPNSVAIWQYPVFNLGTKIALDSIYTYANMYRDMKGLLVASLRSPNGNEKVVYVSPHEVKNKFYNVIIDSVQLQPSRIQTRLPGGQLRYEYVQINSGITVNVLDIDSEYYGDTGMAPTPYVSFKYLSQSALNHYPINAGTDYVSNSDIPANNILEITKPQYGIKINVSGCWGGYRAVWQSSADSVNWSRFNLNLENIPSGTYTISEAIPPEYLTNWFGFQSLVPGSCVTVASYTGFLPTGHKFLRIVNPSQNLIPADTKFPLDNPYNTGCRLGCGGGSAGGGNVSVSVSSVIPGRDVFEAGISLAQPSITGYTNNGVPLYASNVYSIKNNLKQTTPLKDTWFYKFYSGLYTSNKTLATGTWDGIIPSGHSITLEYIATKDHRMGTDNEFRFVYQNYGDNSFIDQSIRNVFKNPTIIETGKATLNPPNGTTVTDPLTGRVFIVGQMMTMDLNTTEAYRRAVEAWRAANSSNFATSSSLTRRGFGISHDLRDAISISNNVLRKGINNLYNQYRKLLPSGVSIYPENSKTRRFRNLYTTNVYDYLSVENIPSGTYGCFKLANKQIICINPPQ